MSKSLSNAAIASFDAMVKHDYQGLGKLRPTVRVKAGVVGSTHRFPKMSKGMAQPRGGTQSDVTPMNVGHSNETAPLSDWVAPEYTDIFDEAKTNVNERAELSYTIAGAITRREDQLIIDALTTATLTKTVSTNVGGTGTNLNTAKVRRAKALLGQDEVPAGDRTFVGHESNLEGLLGDPDASDFDKNAIKALVDGEMNRWVGFNFEWIGNRDEGGLPLAGQVRTCYAYHGGNRGSVGHAVGLEFRTEVNYIPTKTSWLANGIFSAGSVVIDPNGCVEVACTEPT